MVADPVVNETVEQAEADAPQVDPVASEEPVAASEADLGDGGESVVSEAVSEPVVETLEPEPISFTQDELDERDRVRENAGAQRREAELKRDAGSREQTRQRVEMIMQKHGAEIEDPAELYYAWDLASANSRVDAIRDQAEKFGALFGDSEVGTLLMEKFEASASMADLEANSQMVAERAVAHATTAAIRDLSGDDVTEESAPKLHKWIQDEVVRRQELENAVADKDQPDKDPPPVTSQGQTAGAAPTEDPESSYAAASRAFNEGRIDSTRFGELRKKFGVG